MDDSGFWLLWMHTPTKRSVTIEPRRWLEGQPSVVACREHDELGNPIEAEATEPMLFGLALKFARVLRREIVNGQKRSVLVEQGELFAEEETS